MRRLADAPAVERPLRAWALRGGLSRPATLAFAGFGFLAIGFLRAATAIGTPDEAWFLQVVRRVAAGEELYADVWFGSTPLSVYLTVPFVAAFGAEVAWVKLLVAATFAVSLVLVVLLAWKLGIARRFPLLLALAVLVWAAPLAGPLYQPLAGLFLLACFFATISWAQSDPGSASARWLPVASGASAGLALGSKYTVGLLALAAALGSFALADRPQRERLRGAALALLSCAATAVAVVAPALPSARAFFEAAFAGKGTYVDRARLSYLEGFRQMADTVADGHVAASHRLLAVFWAAFFVVAVGALLATAWLAGNGESRREAGMVLLFTAGGLATAYPLFDYAHLVFAAPVVLVGAAYAVHRLTRRLPPRGRELGRMTLALALAVAAAVLVLRPPAVVLLGRERLSSLPHFRAAIVSDDANEAAARSGAVIARAARGQPTFLLMRDAGFYYLLSGVRNPTRFDYPLATTFGRTGEEEVARQIAAGSVRRVCLEPPQAWGRNQPLLLLRFVRRQMEPGANLGVCRLYDR